jgi:hypothetical protein
MKTKRILTTLLLTISCALTALAYHIQEFNNGCTRTCTGDWSWNQKSDRYSCDGTAGPLVCDKGMGNTTLGSGKALPNAVFDRKGAVIVKAEKKTDLPVTAETPKKKKVEAKADAKK